MSSIISKINWITNGERADSVALNRPLLEFISKYETGEITLDTNGITLNVDASLWNASCIDGQLVSFSSGEFKPSTRSTKYSYVGVADVTNSKIYLNGAIPNDLFSTSLIADEKYYMDYNTDGAMITARTDDEPYIGYCVDTNGAGNLVLIVNSHAVIDDLEQSLDGGAY